MDRKIDFFDRIGALIPGYEGYKQREGRRECDRKLRLKIADYLSSVENSLIDNNEKFLPNNILEIEMVRKKTEILKGKIRYASYGASSLFEDSKISNEQLDIIYKLDLSLLDIVEKMRNEVDNANIQNFKVLLEKLETQVQIRNQFLNLS